MITFIITYLSYALLLGAFLRCCVLLIPFLPWPASHLLVVTHWTIFDAIILGLLVIALVLKVWLEKKFHTPYESHSIDDPLEDPKKDCLERAKFSERIFTLIDKTPIDSHMRIGIYGEWGSGKTSVLNFIKNYCQTNGNAVASFSPWQFRDRESAWTGFVSSLDKGLAQWQKQRYGQFERWGYLRKISNFAVKIADAFPHRWAKRIASLVVAPLSAHLKESKAQVQSLLKTTLKDKRLFVFIDDLDRANPDIVYELLMLLNEVVDLNRCVYVIGLDREATAQSLEERIGGGKGTAFLEKIINWPFELPMPSDFDWKRLLAAEVAHASDVDADAMLAVFKFLPKNPRKFKHFIRYVASLHKGFLGRFGRDEINCQFLYVAQLLRFEFPEQFRLIAKNPVLLEHIPSSFLDKMYDERNKNKPQEQHQKPEWVKEYDEIVEKTPGNSRLRFKELFDGMREVSLYMDAGIVKTHLLVVEIPELFTWKEFDEFIGRLRGADDATVLNRLKNFITKEKDEKAIESCREFIKMLQRRRHSFLERASDVSTEPEQKALVASAQELMKFCQLILDVPELFEGENPIFDSETIKDWYGKITHWAHFTVPVAVYEEARASEKQLALKLAGRISKYPPQALEPLTPMFMTYRDHDVNVMFRETHRSVREILDNGIAERLLNRFRQKDGIHSIWGKEVFLYEKGLLFKSPSAFHTSENYESLKRIAETAKKDIEVQKNFVELCRMLFSSVTEFVDWARPEEVKVLLLNDVFRGIVWNAAVANPLNGRTVGGLEEKRKKLIKDVFNGDETKLPTPKWWQAIIQSFDERKKE